MPAEDAAAKTRKGMGLGGWFLTIVGIAGLVVVIALVARRRREDRVSIVDRDLLDREVMAPPVRQPAPKVDSRTPLTHRP
jgi:LPXTG-motif cell wall-anchored protein